MSKYDGIRAGGSAEKDIEQALTALKRGAHLLKYGRRGKPKFCPFRLTNDESALIWFSGKEEKHLKLSHVSRIISGQRTSIFQRYPRPEKEYQSFSLIYNDRSLDLICKDKEEAEVWFSGLKALISRHYQGYSRWGSRSDGISSGASSPQAYTRECSPLNSPFRVSEHLQKDGAGKAGILAPYESPPKSGPFFDDTLYSVAGDVSILSGCSDVKHSHMRGVGADAFRVSLSSALSSSSQGSGYDGGDSLGDVYIWGEGTGDGIVGGGAHRVRSCLDVEMDSLMPKALESAVLLDVHNIACGGRHAALVTKQGETFSWGEELKGRLGHGVDSDVAQPKLIDALISANIKLVSCGEYHSCAVSITGDLYTWGDDHHGLLGHGSGMSHWVPKRVAEPLTGIHVSSISCGPWHTAVVTSAGQLFTFGDGTFGVLGHGDRSSLSKPREVEFLKGLRTVRVACGAWHTAAVVQVVSETASSRDFSSGKLFTWGDGDKFCLGHGDEESRLVPTAVAPLVEQNFFQVACGHRMTVALTTSGHVYAMGAPVHGQLGNPQSDGKLPCRAEGKLGKSIVEEIACGANHTAVLTSRGEVYTWGKGANGRLGHGDVKDRNFPVLVEALKDKQVKAVACGTNFTAAICVHKWVNGIDQSICSGCRLQFSFKRKRHNCYNCGLVFCSSCSSKKSLRASMSPNPSKPYRVCDTCFNKLRKAAAANASSHSSPSRRGSMNFGMHELANKDEKSEARSQKQQLARFSSVETFKQLEPQFRKRNKKQDFSGSCRVSPIPSGGSQFNSSSISKPVNSYFGSSMKHFSASVPGSRVVSRATSPISKRVSPPRSTTPAPGLGGLASSKLAVYHVKMANDTLNQEVEKLKAQVDNLTRNAQLQELELERKTKQLKEAVAAAGEETAKCKAAKEVIKTLSAQLREMAKVLPVDSPRNMASPLLPSNGNASPESNNTSNCSLDQTRHSHPEAVTNGYETKESDSPSEDNEWVEHDEPGVYITITSLPGGFRDLKRVRFSRKRFTETQAEEWWVENRTRVYEQHNVSRRMVEKPTSAVGSEDMATAP